MPSKQPTKNALAANLRPAAKPVKTGNVMIAAAKRMVTGQKK